MNKAGKTKKYRKYLTILLAIAGIGLIAFYKVCDTSCRYLEGDILGIDLTYIGISYMLTIITLAIYKQTSFVRVLLASGIGVEIYLVAFQFQENVFCPYCLAFASIIIIAFVLNHERPLMEDYSKPKRIIYGIGDVSLFPIFDTPLPLMVFIVLGYIFITLTFTGSSTPVYGVTLQG